MWSAPGRNAETLHDFFDALGDRCTSIRAVSIDVNGGYEKAIRAPVPDAEVCFHPFYVVALAGRAVDDVRRAEWKGGVRWALRKNPEHLTDRQRLALAEVQHPNKRLYRAYLLKEQLRALYHLDDRADAAQAPGGLAGLGVPAPSCARSSSPPAPSEPAATASSPPSASGLTNSRLEGLRSKSPAAQLPLRLPHPDPSSLRPMRSRCS